MCKVFIISDVLGRRSSVVKGSCEGFFIFGGDRFLVRFSGRGV